MNISHKSAGVISIVLAICVLTMASPTAHADNDIQQYQVAFTGGIGVRLRTSPQVDAPGFPTPSGDLALPEGAWFAAECEDYGDLVTNIYGESTNVYVRAPGGPWVSTAWLNTGTNGSVGLPLCSQKDAALWAPLEPKTVAAYHREGTGVFMVTNPEQTSGRVYFSKDKTKEAAADLNRADGALFWANTIFSATAGGIIGVATAGLGVAPSVALGAGSDIGLSVLTSLMEPHGFDNARGAANAAASADKCYEVRMHKDLATGEWVSDVWTVTDHGDYCA